MSRAAEADWLSPIVVKEIRQMVRGREFNYALGLSLMAGLIVTFIASATAANDVQIGAGIFTWLMICLTLVGGAVVPLGTFSALRSERVERTLDLITLTSLSPRQIIIGKLLAQAVKLLTLFASLSPFIAMSFLLGGIDFLTISLSLATLFMWSLWACAACLFLSCVSRSRAMSALMFIGVGIVFLLLLGLGQSFYMLMRYGPGVGFGGSTSFGPGVYGSAISVWWPFATMTVACFTTMINLVLLAENRITLPTEDRTSALRIGFCVQFLLMVAAVVIPVVAGIPGYTAFNTARLLVAMGGIHLAVVAAFTVTEDLLLSRRMTQKEAGSRWLLMKYVFRPGGARGAVYVMIQMALLVVVVWSVAPKETVRVLALCGYICFFTGVPTYIARQFAPARARSAYLRVAVLLFFPVLALVADLFAYVTAPLHIFDGSYTVYHILNPFRTLANWPFVEIKQWYAQVFTLGSIGFVSYLALIKMSRRVNGNGGTSN